jgi:hypothetical protein
MLMAVFLLLCWVLLSWESLCRGFLGWVSLKYVSLWRQNAVSLCRCAPSCPLLLYYNWVAHLVSFYVANCADENLNSFLIIFKLLKVDFRFIFIILTNRLKVMLRKYVQFIYLLEWSILLYFCWDEKFPGLKILKKVLIENRSW